MEVKKMSYEEAKTGEKPNSYRTKKAGQ